MKYYYICPYRICIKTDLIFRYKLQ